MKAYVLNKWLKSALDLELKEVPDPVCPEDGILVQVKKCFDRRTTADYQWREEFVEDFDATDDVASCITTIYLYAWGSYEQGQKLRLGYIGGDVKTL